MIVSTLKSGILCINVALKIKTVELRLKYNNVFGTSHLIKYNIVLLLDARLISFGNIIRIYIICKMTEKETVWKQGEGLFNTHCSLRWILPGILVLSYSWKHKLKPKFRPRTFHDQKLNLYFCRLQSRKSLLMNHQTTLPGLIKEAENKRLSSGCSWVVGTVERSKSHDPGSGKFAWIWLNMPRQVGLCKSTTNNLANLPESCDYGEVDESWQANQLVHGWQNTP